MSMQIQDPGPGQRLLNFFGIKGRYRPKLEEYIQPVIQIGDLSQSGIPAVTRHATCEIVEAGVVGQVWAFHMEVPPGLLVVITDFYYSTDLSGSGILASFAGGAPMGPILDKAFTDGRLTAGQNIPSTLPAVIVGSTTQMGVIPLATWRVSLLKADTLYHFQPKGWVCGSGQSQGIGRFSLGGEETNVDVILTVEWDEYQVLL